MLTARLQNRLSLTASGRFDDDDLSLERGELVASASNGRVAGAATYAYLAAQPNRGINTDQHQISGTASVAWSMSSWRLAGSMQYDLEQSPSLATARAFLCLRLFGHRPELYLYLAGRE
jgi:hypothetical protein